MQIQKRWPIVFAVGSVVAYVGNYYTISGIEHLRLQPRRQINPAGATGNPTGSDFAVSSAPSYSLPSTSPAWPTSVPPGALLGSVVNAFSEGGSNWTDQLGVGNLGEGNLDVGKLGVGEKLAVMQDRLSQRFSDITSRSTTATSLAVPISVPGELSPPSLSRAIPPTVRPDNRLTESSALPPANAPQLADSLPSVRVASFNMNNFGSAQLAKQHVLEALTAILKPFEIIAIQGIQSDRDDILPILVERLNQSGRKYDYLIGPRVGRPPQFQQFGFLFDTSRIETDRYQLYSIDDPENLMNFEPLVGWFRCKEAPTDESFTFSLVNVRINLASAAAEQVLLPNLFHAVVNDGRKEDDVLVVGDFGGNPARIPQFNTDSVRLAFRDIPTDVSGSSASQGILFPTKGTTEFSGKAGVLDFLRRHNMSLEQALEVSPNLPVWAEFYTVEGTHPGRIAPTGLKRPVQ